MALSRGGYRPPDHPPVAGEPSGAAYSSERPAAARSLLRARAGQRDRDPIIVPHRAPARAAIAWSSEHRSVCSVLCQKRVTLEASVAQRASIFRGGASLVGVLVAVAACSGQTTEADYTAPSPVCSDAPRWPRGNNFAFEQGGPTNAPLCTPHCGPNKSASSMWTGVGPANKLTSDALPSGPCTEPGVVCTMTAEWLGPCPPEGSPVGPLDLFICRCTSGNWTCTIDASSPSATMWSCRMPDGSNFNRPDAGGS
jgi:hypothetical protein